MHGTSAQAGTPPVLFFSVSGLRGTGRTSLYHELRSLLLTTYPQNTFAFIGNPFDHLPLPLLWDKAERDKHATTRLFDCWRLLNEFTVKKVRPHLQAGHTVITDGFGLDALLYATACTDCQDQNAEAIRLHHELVTARLKAQGLPAPEYLLVQAPRKNVDAWMRSSHSPQLARQTTVAERDAFIAHEERMIMEYFQPHNGQNTPFILKTNPVELIKNRIIRGSRTAELARRGADYIGARLEAMRKAA